MTNPYATKPLIAQAVTSSCSAGTCPTVYSTNRGTYLIQGYAVSGQEAGVQLPAGELLVEIPTSLIGGASGA